MRRSLILSTVATAITVHNLPWNAAIPAGGSTSFGFIAGFNGANGIPGVIGRT
jgi:mannan endo-1,4-beta-mannosidase